MVAPLFLLKKANITTGKQFLFYLTAMAWLTVYAVLSVNIALILEERLSVFFVGLFTGISSLVAIFIDVPFTYLQKVFRPRTLLMISTFGVLLLVLIFIGASEMILLSFLATLLYELSHDLYDITMLSYVFQSSHPEQYAQNISQKNVAEALGLLGGLVLSSAFTFADLPPFWMILVLTFFLIYFVWIFFDKAEYDVPLSEADIHLLKNGVKLADIGNRLKEFLFSATIGTLAAIETAAEAVREKLQQKAIVLKPLTPKEGYSGSKLASEFKDSLKAIFAIFTPAIRWPLAWTSFVVMLFSLWDTFVVTFQPIFITQIVKKNGLNPAMAGVIIALFIVPLFVAQVPFAKLADRLGRQPFMLAGLAVSAASLLLFTFTQDIALIIVAGMANSLGYAMAFPAAQGFFAQRFSENYAVTHHTETMDSNVSAGPLKLILHSGNVVARIGGGIVIALVSFGATFFLISLVTFFLFVLGIVLYSKIRQPITPG